MNDLRQPVHAALGRRSARENMEKKEHTAKKVVELLARMKYVVNVQDILKLNITLPGTVRMLQSLICAVYA